jgi:hypothetical protein
MRCTRCDGLAVPQAVGIAPDGKVVFGYCLQCLADTDCRLVEVPARGPWDLKLSFSSTELPRQSSGQGITPAAPIDQSQWIVGVVAFLMITWGLLVLVAGLSITPRPGSASSPFGNGTTSLLGIGGAFTALLGLGLLILVSRRDAFPGTFLLTLLSWLSFLTALGILSYGIIDYQPRRNVPLVLGSAVAILISVVSRLIERSHRRASGNMAVSLPLKLNSPSGKSNADGPKRLL